MHASDSDPEAVPGPDEVDPELLREEAGSRRELAEGVAVVQNEVIDAAAMGVAASGGGVFGEALAEFGANWSEYFDRVRAEAAVEAELLEQTADLYEGLIQSSRRRGQG